MTAVPQPQPSSLERAALAGRLLQAADRRKLFKLLALFCEERFAASSAAVFLRHRRTGTWQLPVLRGSGLAFDDHRLLIDAACRDRLSALSRIARPLRPYGRLAGGIVLLRRRSCYSPADAARLGRLARVVSAELVRRDHQQTARAVTRLYRKLAAGTGAIDVLYHALDEAARLTAADSVSLVVSQEQGGWRVIAEKLASGPSSAVGRVLPRLEPEQPLMMPVAIPCGDRPVTLLARAAGGDPFDTGDRKLLGQLAKPVALAVDRLESL